jgi:hypothetical protein
MSKKFKIKPFKNFLKESKEEIYDSFIELEDEGFCQISVSYLKDLVKENGNFYIFQYDLSKIIDYLCKKQKISTPDSIQDNILNNKWSTERHAAAWISNLDDKDKEEINTINKIIKNIIVIEIEWKTNLFTLDSNKARNHDGMVYLENLIDRIKYNYKVYYNSNEIYYLDKESNSCKTKLLLDPL